MTRKQSIASLTWGTALGMVSLLLTGAVPGVLSTAQAQLTNATWNGGTGNWSNSANWTPAVVPNNGGGTNYSVIVDGSNAAPASLSNLDIGVTISALSINSDDRVAILNGQLLTLANTGEAGAGVITNAGILALNGGGGANTFLLLNGNTTLKGGGTLTMSVAGGGGSAFIEQAVGGSTLTNMDNTIQGTGIIGNNGLALNNAGTINANANGQTLALSGLGAVTNTNLLEASNGGFLQINGATVNDAGGNITANSGSTVQLVGGTVIQGGTLTNNGGTLGTASGSVASLDGSTGAGAVTINGTYTSPLNTDTFVLGTITNKGNIQVNGGSGTNTLLLLNANTTLQGGGSVTLSTASGGGNAFIEQGVGGLTLTNVDNTIQGAGIIGNNGLSLVNQAGGTVNANVSVGSLVLDGGGAFTNAGLMEASNGGTLQISGVTVNNAGGNITANSGSTVQLVGGTVIQGGTLTNNGGTLGTASGSVASLDGSTGAGAVTINGTYTSPLNTDTFVLGTITNKGNIQVNGGGSTNTLLLLNANTTLQGGGSVTLSTASGGGNAFIEQGVGGLTLTNVDNTIQGAGIIGNNGLSLVNQAGGTVNANVSAGFLVLDGGGAFTNAGLMEASNGGTLQISGVTVNNAGGNITANSGSTVQLVGGTVIQGGTLTNNGGTLETASGSVASLDGSTGAGAVTINGTYTSPLNTDNLCAWDHHQQGQHPGERWERYQYALAPQRQYDAARRRQRHAVHGQRRRQRLHRAGCGRLDPDQRRQHHPGSGHHRQ